LTSGCAERSDARFKPLKLFKRFKRFKRFNPERLSLKTILLIDDDEFILFGLTRAINGCGVPTEVLTAHHGKEAVAILAARNVDVMVTDLKMPVMNGYELVEYANKNFPLLPVYVMTGDYLPDVKPRLRAASVSQLVSKPFSFKQLAADIALLLGPMDRTALAGS
jgi:CheY-like chemotaxis protein